MDERIANALSALLFIAVVTLASATSVWAADDFPAKPVRIIVPTAAGSLPDVFVRKLADRLSRRWGQQVVVENKPGGATAIGAKMASQAPADGYTLFYAPFNTLVVNPHLIRDLPYDPLRDFAPVTITGKAAFVLMVNSTVPARSMAELVAYAKKSPGSLRYGSGGPGTPQHIFGELLKHAKGIDVTHVPYKSAPPALIDLLGGQIQLMFEAVVTTQEHVASGRLRPLAVTSRERLKEFPDVPTLSEVGVSQEDWTLWGGVVVPARTPAERISRLNAAIRAENESPDFGDDIPGSVRVGSTPDEFRQWIAVETVKWKRLVQISGAKIE